MDRIPRADTRTGIRNLCELASHILTSRPRNNASTLALRTLLREAVNKSSPDYRGNTRQRENCQYVSLAALPLLHDRKAALVSDHTLPLSQMIQEMHLKRLRSPDDLVELCARYSLMTLITRAEDIKLKEARLGKDMPRDWDGRDVFARYRKVGIEVVPMPKATTPPAGPEIAEHHALEPVH